MKNTLFVIALLTLAGCNMLNTKPTVDSREWQEVSCSGFADWTKCNEKAARMCPGGYEIAGREESVIAQRRVMKFACTK